MDFLAKNFSLINDIPLFIAAIVAIMSYKKYKHSYVRYFVFFVIYSFLVDFIGGYPTYIRAYEFFKPFYEFLKNTPFARNRWWYTLFWLIGTIVFVSFYFGKVLKNKLHSKIVRYVGVFFVLLAFSVIISDPDSFFIKSFPLIRIMDAIIVFVCVTLYFIQLLKSNQILEFYKVIDFYIASTIFIWWLVTTSMVFFDVYMIKEDSFYPKLRRLIFLFSNIFMYSVFTFALYFCKPEKSMIKNN